MRLLGLTADPEPGGSTYDVLAEPDGTPAFPPPTMYVPVTTAQVDPGENERDRNAEVRGRRGNTAPIVDRQAPSSSFEALAYPRLLRALAARALGNIVGTTGIAPAALTTEVAPIQSGNLPAVFAHVVREEQTDDLSGCVVGEWSLTMPADDDATLGFTLPALYHEVSDTGVAPAAPDTSAFVNPFMLRDVTAYDGDGAGVKIDCLAGAALTFGNGLIEDVVSRYCAGENIKTITLNGKTYRVWFPARHKLGPQAVTGSLNFGTVRPDLETRRIVRDAQKLVLELAGDPLGTTPNADEMCRITIAKAALTGGGAGELVREGDITSSYDFGGYVDPATGDDLTLEFVGTAAVSFAAI